MREFEVAFSRLFRRIEQLERELNNSNRRINNLLREAVVDTVHEGEGMAQVRQFGDRSLSKKLPWITQSGAIRDYVPPSAGQRVLVLNPTGEAGKGLILAGGYSNQFAQPHQEPGEAYRTIGDASDLMTGGKRRIAAAEIELVGNVRILGGVLEHEGKNVGQDHKHLGVSPGPALTGPPE